MLPNLITTPDGPEVLRDHVYNILNSEQANQQLLATSAGQDPKLWELVVLREHTSPLNYWNSLPDSTTIYPPIVNIRIDSSDNNKDGSGSNKRLQYDTRLAIEIYGTAKASGVSPADVQAALSADRGKRIVRQILDAGEYTYLGLPGFVGKKTLIDIRKVYPEIKETSMPVIAYEMSLDIWHSGVSQQETGVPLSRIDITTSRASDESFLFKIQIGGN